ncbi:MAG: 5'-nucleotidase C-terminal domain-containing protein [Bacteroidetes bacterium]|nr:5'-nucleotidase C-terminal domain-containing protein [Bacteroidota bacterium]
MSKIYFKYGLICFVIFTVSCKQYQISTKHYDNIQINNITLDSSIYNLYKPYKDSLDKIMLMPIATLSDNISKQQPSSTLGNLIADILYIETQKLSKDTIDFAITNYGGIRINTLPKGTLKILDAFNIMPFENTIGVLSINDKEVQMLCDVMAQKGGWPISSQINFKIKDGNAIDILINQKPLQENKIYKVAIIDYLVSGGDNMSFLKDKPYTNFNILFRDAIIEYLKNTKEPIIPPNQKRIMYAE